MRPCKPMATLLAYGLIAMNMLTVVMAQTDNDSVPQALASYDDFDRLVNEVRSVREKRLVNFDEFLAMSEAEDTIILDTRSRRFYERKHIKGAINLPFTEFTQASLREVIPDGTTRILIYCNNNFVDDQINFASKMLIIPESLETENEALSSSSQSSLELATINLANNALNMSEEFPQEGPKPIMLALNIPTFINLYGYGYQNVYELNELLSTMDSRVVFEGSDI